MTEKWGSATRALWNFRWDQVNNRMKPVSADNSGTFLRMKKWYHWAEEGNVPLKWTRRINCHRCHPLVEDSALLRRNSIQPSIHPLFMDGVAHNRTAFRLDLFNGYHWGVAGEEELEEEEDLSIGAEMIQRFLRILRCFLRNESLTKSNWKCYPSGGCFRRPEALGNTKESSLTILRKDSGFTIPKMDGNLV